MGNRVCISDVKRSRIHTKLGHSGPRACNRLSLKESSAMSGCQILGPPIQGLGCKWSETKGGGAMRLISIKDLEALTISSLGFDVDSADLVTPEILAALIRKTASFECPCRPMLLAKSVWRLLEPICLNDALHDIVRETVDLVTSHGDLIEERDSDDPASPPLLYLAAPSFFQVSDRRFLLFGIVPDGEDATPPELRQKIESVMYSRRLTVQDPKECLDALLQAGFVPLKLESWLKCPPSRTASEFIAQYDDALSNSGPPGVPEDVVLIDAARPVNYYNGRWTKLKKQTGRFIGRRSQTYGAQLWCYLEVIDGRVTRLLDLPLYETHWRAFDEAWHLLQAIDATSGHPQGFRVCKASQKGMALMDLFSPVPTWAIRRWDAVGLRTMPNSSLMSYIFPETRIGAECTFAAERMWLTRL